MATKVEAKKALWEASKKDKAAREFLSAFIGSLPDGPGDAEACTDEELAAACSGIRGDE